MRSDNHPALFGLYYGPGGPSYRATMSRLERRAMIEEYDTEQKQIQNIIDQGFMVYIGKYDKIDSDLITVLASKPVDISGMIYADLNQVFAYETKYRRELRENLEDGTLTKCERCGNIWDGNAQCYPCNYYDEDN